MPLSSVEVKLTMSIREPGRFGVSLILCTKSSPSFTLLFKVKKKKEKNIKIHSNDLFTSLGKGMIQSWERRFLQINNNYTLYHLENDRNVSAYSGVRQLLSRAQLVCFLKRSKKNTRIDA